MIQRRFLSADQRRDFKDLLRIGTQEYRVARRIHAILLLDQGMSCQEVAGVLFLDDDTVRDFYKSFIQGGLKALETFDYDGSYGFLNDEQKHGLTDFVRQKLPRTVQEVAVFLKETYDIEYASKSGLSKLMRSLGFVFHRPKQIPSKLDVEKQEDFVERITTLQENLPKDHVIVSADAVHPQHAARPTGFWGPKEETIVLPQTSGRDRLNIHGALNPATGQMTTITAETIDAQAFIRLLQALLLAYPTMVMIHVILDNARYHHAKAVKEWVAQNGNRFQFHFLPAYCPHLNWVERVWYFMHKYVIHNQTHATFKLFTEAILKTLNETIQQKWEQHRKYVVIPLRVVNPKDFRVLT
jgi:transposase